MSIHTVYVAAHAFDATTPRRYREEARRFFAERFPDPASLAALGIDGDLAAEVHPRVVTRLERDDAVADLRVDFEDGYGPRSDDEEDADAVRCARAAVDAHRGGELPTGFGLRIRSLEPATATRGLRTLDLFGDALADCASPPAFVVVLPKITDPAQVTALADALGERERRWGLAAGSIRVELMAETPQSIYLDDGRLALPTLLAAGRGRVAGVHLGVFDYTASMGVVAGLQGPRHPVCDHAVLTLQAGLALSPAGDEVELSHGSSRLDPAAVPAESRLAAAREVYGDVRHQLDRAIHRGWDMTPAHVALRHLATIAFYREHLPTLRHRTGALTDPATDRAVATYLRRAVACGALDGDEG